MAQTPTHLKFLLEEDNLKWPVIERSMRGQLESSMMRTSNSELHSKDGKTPSVGTDDVTSVLLIHHLT